MFFEPQWYKKLPSHLKPNRDKIKALEALRLQLDFSDDIFWMGIANSRWAVIQAQKATFEQLKRDMPNATDKELWTGVLLSRLSAKLTCETAAESCGLKIPRLDDLSRDEIVRMMENISDIMANINSFDELLNYILSIEEKNLMDYDPIQRQIDDVLFDRKT